MAEDSLELRERLETGVVSNLTDLAARVQELSFGIFQSHPNKRKGLTSRFRGA